MSTEQRLALAASRAVGRVSLAVPLILAAACGGSSTPTVPGMPSAPSPKVVLQETWPRVLAHNVYFGEFSTDRAGTIEATFDFTLDTNRITIWIARGRCDTVDFAANRCAFVATSLPGPRPRKLVVVGAPAGNYTFYLLNDGPGDESVSFQIVLIP